MAEPAVTPVVPAYRFGAAELPVDRATAVALAGVARAVVAAALRLLTRLAGTGRLTDLLDDVDSDWLDFVLDPPDGLDGGVARPDLIYSGGRFRCVDLNAAHAGGWNAGVLWRSERHDTSEWHGRDDGPTAPAVAVFDLVHRCAASRGVVPEGHPVNLVVVRDAHSPEFDESARLACLPLWRAAVARAGVSGPGALYFADAAELRVDQDRLWYHGDPVHALIEGAVSDSPARLRWVSLFKRHKLSLHSGPVAALVNDRRLLAELSRLADSADPSLPATERSMLRAALPWTRRLLPDLADDVLRRREELVLKQVGSDGGRHVHLGWCTPPEQWRALVADGLAGRDWVVQRYLPPEHPPRLALSPDTHLIWGVFVVGDRCAGGFARVLDRGDYRWSDGGSTAMARGANGDAHVPIIPFAPVSRSP